MTKKRMPLSVPAHAWTLNASGQLKHYADVLNGQVVHGQPMGALRMVRHVQLELERSEERIVWSLRHAGYSWASIGEVLGVSRQAAQMRFGTFVERFPEERENRPAESA